MNHFQLGVSMPRLYRTCDLKTVSLDWNRESGLSMFIIWIGVSLPASDGSPFMIERQKPRGREEDRKPK